MKLWKTRPRFPNDSGGDRKMANYNLYYLLGNALTGADHIEAADDQEARRIAKERAGAQTVEVWNGYERVGVMTQAKAKPTSRQP